MSFSFYTNIAHTFDVRYLIFDSFVFFVLHIKLNSEMWSTLTAHWIRFVDDNHVFVMISTFQWRNFSRPLMRFRSLSLPFFFIPVDTFGWFFPLILFYVSILWVKLSVYISSINFSIQRCVSVITCFNYFSAMNSLYSWLSSFFLFHRHTWNKPPNYDS